MSGSDSTVADDPSGGPRRRLTWWLLIEGDRVRIAAGATVLTFLATLGLAVAGVVTLGPRSYVASIASGLIAGLLTLVTVTLSINQLILSRIFGTPNELSDELDGSRRFRADVEELVNQPTVPTDPGGLLSVVGETLHARASRLRERVDDAGGREDAEDLSAVVAQAETLREIDPEAQSTTEILQLLLGSRTAENLSTVDRLRDTRADDLSSEGLVELDEVTRLLEAVAIASRYYKTLLLQQTLAQSSRYITYTGAVSIPALVYVALLYRTGAGPAVDAGLLPLVASAGVAVGFAPLAVLLSYVLRVATISRYTLSVGPFAPPAEKIR